MSDDKTTLDAADRVTHACMLATGRVGQEAGAKPAGRITAAHKDLNAKGRGAWWYRMVWRSGTWEYYSDERLPMGTFLAHDRRATVQGDVWAGEIIVTHDKGSGLDSGGYLVCTPDADGKVLVEITWTKRRDGNLVFAMPDGSEIVTPNPRAR